MASASSLLCEEQFLCSICLDVFTEPVSTPCGHNFCKACITKYWDKNDQCHCPLCKMPFANRPNLFVNTLVSEMAAQFKPVVDVKAASSHGQEADKPVEVPCDFCCGTEGKALKSCLVCLASYCETHLEPHQRVAALKRHKLIDPVENLEDRMCKKHDKMLELFCRTDQLCVCVMCTEHKTHDTVPLEEECEEKKAQMDKMKAEVQQMILERQLKVRQINNSVQLSKKKTQEEVAKTAEVFTALVASIQRNQTELIKVVEEKQRATEKQAEVFIEELEEEITELQRRNTDLECLSLSEDHLHLLRSFPSFSSSPHTKNWSDIIIRRNLSLEVMRRAVVHLEETHNKKMTAVLKYIEMIKEHIGRLPEPVTLRKIQELYAVDVTLDPNTAQAELIVSEDGKQVRYGDIVQDLPDNPERFDEDLNVIGKEGFSSGKFYFEAQVKEDDWDIGVVSESINRKGDISYCPAEGYWIIWLKEGNILQALNDPIICLSLSQRPEKVGVFVDYEEGRVSFYDVKAGNLIYCFMDCNFTEKIYPFFSPNYDEGDPLIITPVELTE